MITKNPLTKHDFLLHFFTLPNILNAVLVFQVKTWIIFLSPCFCLPALQTPPGLFKDFGSRNELAILLVMDGCNAQSNTICSVRITLAWQCISTENEFVDAHMIWIIKSVPLVFLLASCFVMFSFSNDNHLHKHWEKIFMEGGINR